MDNPPGPSKGGGKYKRKVKDAAQDAKKRKTEAFDKANIKKNIFWRGVMEDGHSE
jgi:hypothetical protein